MPQGLLIRLRPTTPWRIGPSSGDRDRVDRILHSDSLYAAVTGAIARLGELDAWLDATARASEPAVRFSSCFPLYGDSLLVTPPRSLWPPPPSAKVRWKGAQFVPMGVVASQVAGKGVSEDGWTIDTASECLLPAVNPPAPGPFRIAVRSSAAVDREGVGVAPHSTACLEFSAGNGLWMAVAFRDDAARDQWSGPVSAAIRLLADSGIGGERSRGWGRTDAPEISTGDLNELLGLSGAEPQVRAEPPGSAAWWLLSLYHPSASESIEWSRGNYAVTTRSGRVESSAGWGEPKRETRMLAEGSVVVAAKEPLGSAPDVAPGNFAHPVYRNGFALALPIAGEGAAA
jgi:CRISPR type III-A-associated RAMP protein Csm4